MAYVFFSLPDTSINGTEREAVSDYTPSPSMPSGSKFIQPCNILGCIKYDFMKQATYSNLNEIILNLYISSMYIYTYQLICNLICYLLSFKGIHKQQTYFHHPFLGRTIFPIQELF